MLRHSFSIPMSTSADPFKRTRPRHSLLSMEVSYCTPKLGYPTVSLDYGPSKKPGRGSSIRFVLFLRLLHSVRCVQSAAFPFQFYGVHNFRFPMSELRSLVYPLSGAEVEIRAKATEYFSNITHIGYVRVRMINETLSLRFLGTSPQIFKPGMPFITYVSIFVFILFHYSKSSYKGF